MTLPTPPPGAADQLLFLGIVVLLVLAVLVLIRDRNRGEPSSHGDMRDLVHRVGNVEQTVAGLSSGFQANRESIARIERMLEMLVRHQIEEERKP